MKLYLILLFVSAISFVVVTLESITYREKNYHKINNGHRPFTERINTYIKAVIITALIVPNIATVLLDIFTHDTFMEKLESVYSESEDYEPIEH